MEKPVCDAVVVDPFIDDVCAELDLDRTCVQPTYVGYEVVMTVEEKSTKHTKLLKVCLKHNHYVGRTFKVVEDDPPRELTVYYVERISEPEQVKTIFDLYRYIRATHGKNIRTIELIGGVLKVIVLNVDGKAIDHAGFTRTTPVVFHGNHMGLVGTLYVHVIEKTPEQSGCIVM